jgi:hypothetical protein
MASMLLRFGVGYKEFAEACKIAFVDVASEKFGVRRRRANISRVALMTGLSRKEIRTVREKSALARREKSPLTHYPAQVLRLWFTDARFCDSSGNARPLSWDGGSESFVELVRKCGSSLSPVAMREELLRIGAITQDISGVLSPLRRYLIADAAKDRLTEGIRFGIRPLALTVARNAAAEGLSDLRFQRVVDSYSIPAERRAALEQKVSARLRQFSEEMDDLLSEVGEASVPGDNTAVGVGLFYFEDCEDD